MIIPKQSCLGWLGTGLYCVTHCNFQGHYDGWRCDGDVGKMAEGNSTCTECCVGRTKQVIVQKGQPDGFVVCLFLFFLPFLIFFWGEATRVKGRYQRTRKYMWLGCMVWITQRFNTKLWKNSCYSMFEKAHSVDKPWNPQCVAQKPTSCVQFGLACGHLSF